LKLKGKTSNGRRSLIEEILGRDEFQARPPVLVDIGASGGLPQEWSLIAPYSVCIAFDPDDREIGYAEAVSGDYRKLFLFHSIVSENDEQSRNFFLTRSPYCSSLLEPDVEKLENWAFAGLFTVEKQTTLKATTLSRILDELEIGKIDWFKVDSQGCDWRLFHSLGTERMRKTIVADFEPGIIDAYRGEDKLHTILRNMEGEPFWMCDCRVQGTTRLRPEYLEELIPDANLASLRAALKQSPGWAEISYMNDFRSDCNLSERDFLLGIVFCLVKEQFGAALEITRTARNLFHGDFFGHIDIAIGKLLMDETRATRRTLWNKFRILFGECVPPIFYRVARKLARSAQV